MAYTNRQYNQVGCSLSLPHTSQLFSAAENVGWGSQTWPVLYEDPPSIEPGNSFPQRGVYAQMFPTNPIGSNPQETLYMPAGVHAVLPTPSRSPENQWALQNVLHPDPVPFNPSPSFAPATSSSAVQFVVPPGPPVSTNPPPNYTWVPQRQYALTAYHFTPAHPILFDAGPGEVGIRLSAALNRRFAHLRDRDDLVFESSRSPTITMRLEWPGYASWSRQVRILDSRSVRQSISREKLAYEVAKTVLAFAQPQNGKRSAEGDADRHRVWALGEGNLNLDDLVLVRVENVSKGSWQPQFLVDRRHRN